MANGDKNGQLFVLLVFALTPETLVKHVELVGFKALYVVYFSVEERRI